MIQTIVAPALVAAATWVLHSQSSNVAVYSRSNEDGALEYRVTATIAAPVGAVGVVLISPMRFGTTPGLVEERILQEGETLRILYNRWKLPVIAERDFCIEAHLSRGGLPRGGWRQEWRPWPGCEAPAGGAVRLGANEGFWTLEPDEHSGATRFVMETRVEPGGWIPSWLAPPFIIASFQDLVPAVERAARQYAGGGS
jgi:hypothetical protein